MPHIFPCPVDRRQYADSGPDSSKRRRRRAQKENDDATTTTTKVFVEDADTMAQRRACPVPKPNGLLGQIMGFTEDKDRDGALVVVKSLQEAKHRRKSDGDAS